MEKFIIDKRGVLTDLATFAGISAGALSSITNATSDPFKGKDGLKLNYERDRPLDKLSSLGTHIFSDLTLKYIQPYTIDNGSLFEPIKNDINIETVIITIEQNADIVRTQIQGRNGRIKEYIGLDDAKITINGQFTAQNGVYPREQTNNLLAWLRAPVTKGITTWWLENMDIYNLVVDSYNIPQVEGEYSTQYFTIECSSDLPVELKIIQPVT